MDILINELSLHEQFNSIENFSEKLVYMMQITKIIKELNFSLLKKSDLWNYKPVKNVSLNDILRINGNDSVRKYKSLLSSIITDEPFWDNNQSHSLNDTYLFSNSSVINTSLAEACERDKLIISFNSTKYNDSFIIIKKNNHFEITLANFFDNNFFLDWMIQNNKISLTNYCFKRFKNYKVDFIYEKGEIVFNTLLEKTSLTESLKISEEIKKMILEYLDSGNLLPENLSKNLSDGIFELRISFDSRICRLLYFYGIDKTIVFTHGFIKKVQKTPQNEISYAKKMKNAYESSPKSNG
jgi:phage-related protein